MSTQNKGVLLLHVGLQALCDTGQKGKPNSPSPLLPSDNLDATCCEPQGIVDSRYKLFAGDTAKSL